MWEWEERQWQIVSLTLYYHLKASDLTLHGAKASRCRSRYWISYDNAIKCHQLEKRCIYHARASVRSNDTLLLELPVWFSWRCTSLSACEELLMWKELAEEYRLWRWDWSHCTVWLLCSFQPKGIIWWMVRDVCSSASSGQNEDVMLWLQATQHCCVSGWTTQLWADIWSKEV